MRWPTLTQKRLTFARLNYRPNVTQAVVHRSTAKVLQIVGAEGGGKSRVTAAELIACLPWCKLIYLVGQKYEAAQPEFNYLVEALLQLKAIKQTEISRPKHGVWQMETSTKCQIITLSVERGASSIIARGEQPDIIVLCEAGVISSFSVMTAATRRVTRSRGRVIMVGTLRDNHGWYAKLIDEFRLAIKPWGGETYNLPAWTNTYLYPGGRNDPEIKRLEAILPPDEFARTIAAERMPSQALVFGRTFDYEVHFRDVTYRPELKVTLWIDPGYFPSVYTVLAVQFIGDVAYNFDEIYLNHHTHDETIEVCRNRPWWGNVERIVIDIAGKAHTADNPKSAVELWSAGTGIMPNYNLVDVMEGVARHRSILQQRRLVHDYGCVGTRSEYDNYVVPTDRDRNPTSDKPVDKHNHAMKAIAYGLIDKFGYVESEVVEVKTWRRDVIKEIEIESAWN